MTIGELAAASGIKVTTIRFYERIGVMPLPQRTAGGHRNYNDDHLRRLSFICRARELQFTVEETRLLLSLAAASRNSCMDVRDVAAIHLKQLRQTIADLTRLESVLSTAIEQCSGEQPCPVLELLNSAR